MIDKPTPESIELDNYLSRLTDIGLETDSDAIFQLCETVRDCDLFANERSVLESFINWATLESSKFIKPIEKEIDSEAIDPNQGELFPDEPIEGQK